MRVSRRFALVLAITCGWLMCLPPAAHAYIGPGVGITAIGTVIAFIGAIILAIVGFVWYPIKRLLATLRNQKADRHEAQKASSS